MALPIDLPRGAIEMIDAGLPSARRFGTVPAPDVVSAARGWRLLRFCRAGRIVVGGGTSLWARCWYSNRYPAR